MATTTRSSYLLRCLIRWVFMEGLLRRPFNLLVCLCTWSALSILFLLRIPLWAKYQYHVSQVAAVRHENCTAATLQHPQFGSNNNNNKACLRFANLHHQGEAGLGHHVAEMVFGMKLALQTNATFAVDTAIWEVQGAHGRYTWLPTLLPLQRTEVSLSQLHCFAQQQQKQNSNNDPPIRTIYGQWHDVVKQSKLPENACNVLFQSRMDACCDARAAAISPLELCWCTYSETLGVGAYDLVKDRMRAAYALSSYQPPLFEQWDNVQPKHAIRIAWHVRGGDIVLNGRQEYFDVVAWQLVTALDGLPRHVFFFGEQTLFYFPFLSKICQRHFDNQCSFPELEEQVTLHYMVASDVLLTSGSSFSYFAALLKSNGIVLNAFSKDNQAGVYELSEHGVIQRNGTIVKPTILQLTQQLQSIYDRKRMDSTGT